MVAGKRGKAVSKKAVSEVERYDFAIDATGSYAVAIDELRKRWEQGCIKTKDGQCHFCPRECRRKHDNR